MLPIRTKSDQRSFRAIGLFVPGVLSPLARLPRAGIVYTARQNSTMVSAYLRRAGVVGSASASEHCFVRAQAAQAAPNIWLESLHLGTLRGNQSKSSGRSLTRL
jgi:hypothetical protein